MLFDTAVVDLFCRREEAPGASPGIDRRILQLALGAFVGVGQRLREA